MPAKLVTKCIILGSHLTTMFVYIGVAPSPVINVEKCFNIWAASPIIWTHIVERFTFVRYRVVAKNIKAIPCI